MPALDTLESDLWEAANILRGPVDAADFKTYIFPMLFFKRISDVFDEEIRQALEESEGDQRFALFPENHRFQIPAKAHWEEVRSVPKNIGQALQTALRAVEQANPETLFGIFGDANWTNKDRLSDAVLRNLIEHFSAIDLSNAKVDSDVLGQAYEYLIKKFADLTNKKAGEFYTPRSVVRLMVDILDPQEGETIYDPACGTGGMLLGAVQHVRESGRDIKLLYGKLYGQEKNLTTSAIARINLFLHGFDDFQIVRGDTLAEPKLIADGRLRRFDLILANPPYSIKAWDRKKWGQDPYGRNLYGTPPQGRADYAFWQHILASLEPDTGRCALLFPHGVLFRVEEQEMREKIVRADVIDAVLGLGPNLFYNSLMEACVVVCRTRKPPERKGKILFIDAKNEVTRERAQSFLTESHMQRIVAAYHAFANEEGFARPATRDEIAANRFNLNIPLYIRSNGASAETGPTLEEVLDDWESSSAGLRAAMDDLFAALGAAPPAPTPVTTRHVASASPKNRGGANEATALERI